MLEINLLPGGRRKRPAFGSLDSLDAKAAVEALLASVRDPWLLFAGAAVVIALAATGALYTTQRTRTTELDGRLEVAIRDSTRYAKALDQQLRLQAERDSVQRQLAVIRSIDETRYTWSHILDEVSRALPAYTWITLVEQTSAPPEAPAVDTTAAKPDAGAAKGSAAAAVPPAPPLAFKLVGQTVDIQALTLFMRQLEGSPFVQAVALTKSEIVIVDGKDVTQFELTAQFETPPPGVVQTSPLIIPVR
jgi:Tfp pilus assembly protein PilN